jgi:hypothetical protein
VKLTLTTLAGETRTVVATAADKVAWEAWARRQGLPMSPRVDGAGTDHATVDTSTFPLDTYHLYLAWRADTRGDDDRPPFATWLDDKESVMPGEAPDPTQPAPLPA